MSIFTYINDSNKYSKQKLIIILLINHSLIRRLQHDHKSITKLAVVFHPHLLLAGEGTDLCLVSRTSAIEADSEGGTGTQGSHNVFQPASHCCL